MGTELAIIEPIALPDQRRPTAMPSLPEWLDTQLGSLNGKSLRDEQTGLYKQIPTVPTRLLPTPEQRQMIAANIRYLQSLLDQTPENSAEHEGMTLIAVTKMLLVLGGHKATADSTDAKGEAYTAALDDVPYWAVESALRRWHRGECGSNGQGEPHNYSFAPSPADLRRIANGETVNIKCRVKALTHLLSAVERDEYSDQHCEKMVVGLQSAIKGSLGSMS